MASQRNYQQLKNELEKVMNELQHEDTDIDHAIKLHKQAQAILSEIEKYLDKTAMSSGLDIKTIKNE